MHSGDESTVLKKAVRGGLLNKVTMEEKALKGKRERTSHGDS